MDCDITLTRTTGLDDLDMVKMLVYGRPKADCSAPLTGLCIINHTEDE